MHTRKLIAASATALVLASCVAGTAHAATPTAAAPGHSTFAPAGDDNGRPGSGGFAPAGDDDGAPAPTTALGDQQQGEGWKAMACNLMGARDKDGQSYVKNPLPSGSKIYKNPNSACSYGRIGPDHTADYHCSTEGADGHRYTYARFFSGSDIRYGWVRNSTFHDGGSGVQC
ncbi:hypothetical protein ACFU98_39380 [Streptomyces sp. NPDC057575]|uniref:hypothetical protein n=1 Tax=unclassified Streptomyces TaxID=2593676 RepID=UPI0036A0AAE9